MLILGTGLVLLGLYFLYLAICIARIPDEKYEAYKAGLGSPSDVFWGRIESQDKDLINTNFARNSTTGELLGLKSYKSIHTKSLFLKQS